MAEALTTRGFCGSPRTMHTGSGVWEESNCYLDVLIELLYSSGLPPEPALAVTLSADWEGDQWTFCKFNDEDLRCLYALDIQELNPWDDLHDHVVTQVQSGHPVLIEVDSWFLPDTRGSAYHRAHVKTTIAVMSMDPAKGVMGYLHGTGAWTLQDADYQGIWLRAAALQQGALPPYVERVRYGNPVQPDDRVTYAMQALQREVARMPQINPVEQFARFAAEPELAAAPQQNLERVHRFAFATFRQIGSGAELASHHLRWLSSEAGLNLLDVSQTCIELARLARAEQFRFARCASRGKPFVLSPLMAELWDSMARDLRNRLRV